MIVPTSFKRSSKYFVGKLIRNRLKGKNLKTLEYFEPSGSEGWYINTESVVVMFN